MQSKIKQISMVTLTLTMLTIPILKSATNVNAKVKNWDWANNEHQNPNQYWEMYQNKPLIQHTNANHEITYAITALPTNKYFKAWKYAVNKYNQLGVIKLVPTTEDKAQIKLAGSFNFAKGEALNSVATHAKPDLDGDYGLTTFNENSSNGKYNYLSNTVCTLATSISFYNDMHFYQAVAQHELGHALGFEHNPNQINGEYTVMKTDVNYDTINDNQLPKNVGSYEKQVLIDHYYN